MALGGPEKCFEGRTLHHANLEPSKKRKTREMTRNETLKIHQNRKKDVKKKSQKCVFFLRPQKNRSGAAGAPKWYQK